MPLAQVPLSWHWVSSNHPLDISTGYFTHTLFTGSSMQVTVALYLLFMKSLSFMNDSIMNLPDISGSFLISFSSIRDTPLIIDFGQFHLDSERALPSLTVPPWLRIFATLRLPQRFPKFLSLFQVRIPSYSFFILLPGCYKEERNLPKHVPAWKPSEDPHLLWENGSTEYTVLVLLLRVCLLFSAVRETYILPPSLTMSIFLWPRLGLVPHSLLWNLSSSEYLPISDSFFYPVLTFLSSHLFLSDI